MQFVTHYTCLYQPTISSDGINGALLKHLAPDATGRFGHRTHGWKPRCLRTIGGEGFGEPLGLTSKTPQWWGYFRLQTLGSLGILPTFLPTWPFLSSCHIFGISSAKNWDMTHGTSKTRLLVQQWGVAEDQLVNGMNDGYHGLMNFAILWVSHSRKNHRSGWLRKHCLILCPDRWDYYPDWLPCFFLCEGSLSWLHWLYRSIFFFLSNHNFQRCLC